jgi:hypothetical protein
MDNPSGVTATVEETLTPARCRTIAAGLRDVTATLGLRLQPASDLARMFRELSWLGEFPDGAQHPAAAIEADKRRGTHAFMLVDQANRIAAAWYWGRALPGVLERAQVIKKQLDRNRSQEGPAHDFLFELDIAAKLARSGLDVRFEEPDLVLYSDEAGTVGLACKRPHSAGGIPSMLRRGTHQIEASGMPGAVVVGLEAIFHRSGDPAKPVAAYQGHSRKDLIEEATQQVGAVLGQVRPWLDKACTCPSVAGVLLCGVITAWIEEPSAYIFQWVWTAVADDGTAEALDGLGRLLFQNDPLPIED